MTSDAQKLAQTKICLLIERLRQGHTVSKSAIATSAGTEALLRYESEWIEELKNRAVFATRNGPPELKEYERLLWQGDFFNNRWSAASGCAHQASSSSTLSGQPAIFYQRALDYLQHLLEHSPSMEMWFDRTFSFEVDVYPDPDVESVPRLWDSKSRYNGPRRAYIWRSKNDVKLDVLTALLAELTADAIADVEDAARCGAMLVQMRRSLERVAAR